MFVSPCTLRSTQCAALIALAAVAGIARVETHRLAHRSADSTAKHAVLTQRVTGSLDRFFAPLTSVSSAPWLQSVATVALWIFNRHETASPTATLSATSPTPSRGAHHAFAAAAPGALPPPAIALIAPSPLPRTTHLRAALSTVSHLIPFAVGPPARALNLPHRAVGTFVPADATVRCPVVLSDVVLFARSPVPSRSRSVARLACPEFSGHSSAGPSFSPSSALRGEPAPFPALSRFRPSLGASARPGTDSLILLT